MEIITIRVESAGNDYLITLIEQTGTTTLAPLAHSDVHGGQWTPKTIQARYDTATQPTSDLSDIGTQLGRWLMQPPIAARLATLRAQPMRVALDLLADDLAWLPWELVRSLGTPDFLNPQSPVMRLHRTAKPVPTMQWPLKVLIVVGAAPGNTIRVEEEVREVERVLHPYGHSIDRQVLWRPTQQQLFDLLERFAPHVLLFAGHAEVDAVSKQTVLRFQGPTAWNWSSDSLAVDLQQTRWTPTLVILNACRTSGRTASFRLSDKFIDAGVPACITTQADVNGEQAGRFSSAVFDHICKGDALDVAVSKARNQLRLATDLNHRDWSIPVLSLSCAPELLFAARPQSPQRQRLAVTPMFRDAHIFASRREDRRRLRSHLNISGAPSLVVVTGAEKSGKTHLVKWCLENFALLFNATIQYVPQAAGVPDNSVSLMRRICHGDSTGPGALPQVPLSPFYWTLNAILNGKPPGEWDGKPVPDADMAFDPAKVAQYEHAIPTLFRDFCGALRAAAAQNKLVIALDNFLDKDSRQRIMDQHIMRDEVVPYLLRPISEGKIPGLLMVLVMDSNDCAYYGIDTLVPESDWIRMEKEFPPADEYPHLCQELFWYPSQDVLKGGLQGVVDAFKDRMIRDQRSRLPVAFTPRMWNSAANVLTDMKDSDDRDLRRLLQVSQMG